LGKTIALRFEIVRFLKKPALYALKTLNFKLTLPSLAPLVHFPHPSPLSKVKVQYEQTVCGREEVGLFSFVGDHIVQEFNTLFLTRLRIYKIALPPQIKT
jgi:hypothetical protein